MRLPRSTQALCFIAMAAASLVLLFPVYWMMMTAVTPVAEILSRDPPLLPHFASITFGSFAAVLSRRPFLLWTANSMIVGFGSTLVSLTMSALAGYSLSRYSFPGVRFAGAALLLGKLAPPSLIIIPLFIVFSTFGMLDTYGGLVLAHVSTGVPLATWLMKGFFDRIPREVEQAALIDGCTRIGALRHVILPLTKPGLASCGVYLLLVSWSEFVFGRTLMSNPDHRVLTVGLQSFSAEYQVDWPGLMAAGTLTIIPIAVMFVLLEPFLVSGLTKGALAN